MSHEAPAHVDTISDKDLTELLADAEGATPEEIKAALPSSISRRLKSDRH